jgi:hypothetical protein
MLNVHSSPLLHTAVGKGVLRLTANFYAQKLTLPGIHLNFSENLRKEGVALSNLII